MKVNCWEIMNCGRGPGGNWVEEFGICPAAVASDCDNLNGGTNGGRICWAIAGTLCDGREQGTFVDKRESCMECRVFTRVRDEEGSDFQVLLPGQAVRICTAGTLGTAGCRPGDNPKKKP